MALLCCLLCLLGAALAQAAEDEAAPIFRPDAIYVIDLQLPQASFETLEDEPEEEYVEGTFSIAESDGTPGGLGPFTTPQMVGIRLKGGDGSFKRLKDQKAAFKIKFNFENAKKEKGKKFLGLKKLTLNNMVQDSSMLHETMTYEAFRALGVPAPRTGYANVYVNGVNYGVHLNVETYDDVSLPHFFASTQHLYEADAPGTDVRTGEQGTFEIDEGDPPPTDLEALIAAANDGTGDWSDGMAGVADLDEMTWMWAVERYVGHWDGYAGVDSPPVPPDPPFRPNNYYLHSDDAGLFSMLPWGTDQTWEDDVEFDQPAGGLLFNECFGDASCKALYVEALRATQGAVGGLALDAQAPCLATKLAPWQALEDAGRREFDSDEIAQGVEEAEEFVAGRPGELSGWLASQAGEGEGSALGPPAPCILPEPHDDEGAAGSGSSTSGSDGAGSLPKPPAGRRFALRGVDVGRRWLSASVRTGGPGDLTLAAKIATAKGAHVVCDRELHVDRAGELSPSCRLSAVARRRLRSRDLKLHVLVAFVPEGGQREVIAHDVSLPRGRRTDRPNRSG